MTALSGEKVLITGATGQVALPVAIAMAADSEVWAIARFNDAGARARLEAAGVKCIVVDFEEADFTGVPDDFAYVLNFGVAKSNDFDRDLAGNAEATGLLMAHCRSARAFLHCSSTAVYQPDGHHRFAETDPLGDNHRAFGFMPTYSISKIATEAVVRTEARQLNLPTTIARLSAPFGDNGGWPAFHLEMMIAGQAVPVHVDAPSEYNLIHEDDIIATVPGLLDAAGVPATIVNWAGNEIVSIEEWCAELGRLTGLDPKFGPTERTIESVAIDTTKMHELIGTCAVDWRDGFRRMVQARHPELLQH
jgi:UDP-glucuronate 4-epimerase